MEKSELISKLMEVYATEDKVTLLNRLEGFLYSVTNGDLKTIWFELTDENIERLN